MEHVIKISWPNGSMQLVLDLFFPTDIARTKKVLKLLVADPDWTTERIDALAEHFADRAKTLKAKAAELRQLGKESQAKADELKAKKPRRNTDAYSEWVEVRDRAYSLGVQERETTRNAERIITTRTMLLELDGRSA